MLAIAAPRRQLAAKHQARDAELVAFGIGHHHVIRPTVQPCSSPMTIPPAAREAVDNRPAAC